MYSLTILTYNRTYSVVICWKNQGIRTNTFFFPDRVLDILVKRDA